MGLGNDGGLVGSHVISEQFSKWIYPKKRMHLIQILKNIHQL